MSLLLLCRRGRVLRPHTLYAPLLLRTLATTGSKVAWPPQPQPPSSPFTIHFLTTSCGLTLAQAVSAARTLRLDEKNREKFEFVLAALRSHGFSGAQVTELVARYPRVILCRTQQKLEPKLQFLTRAGFSAALIAQDPRILRRSLDRYLRPCVDFFRCIIGSDEKLHTMFWRHKWVFNFDIKSTMIPNVTFLLELGVPVPAISRLMVSQPRSLMANCQRFAEIVQTVQSWGLKPEKNLFVYAVRAIGSLTESSFASKLELFKNLGWSEEEVISALKRGPMCILASEQKILCMDSFAKKLGLGPFDLSREPKLLMYGFDKRILPRYRVWQVLTSKGLIRRRTEKLVSLFTISEKLFLDRYVTGYVGQVPELMDVYCGNIKVEEFDLGGEENS